MKRTGLYRIFLVILLLISSLVWIGAVGYALEDGDWVFDEAFCVEMAGNKTSAYGFEYVEGNKGYDLWDKDGLGFAITYIDDGGILQANLFSSVTDDDGRRGFGFCRFLDPSWLDFGLSNQMNWNVDGDSDRDIYTDNTPDDLFMELSKEFARNPTEENFLALYARAEDAAK